MGMKTTGKIGFILLFMSIFFFSVTGRPLHAQSTDSLAVLLQVQPGKDNIKLRWVMNDAQVWSKSLSAGYTIERYTIKRNGLVLAEQEKKILTPDPVTVTPEEGWESLVQRSEYAAILAQAIFGETFEVTGFNANMINDIVNQSEMLKQRYSFALYAADRCFECACLAGWGYEDREVQAGEYYLYRVIPTGLAEQGDSVQYGFGYTGIDEYYELPRPIDLTAIFGDKSVQLYWNTSLYREKFTAYQVEKSEDNQLFKPQGMPYTPLDERDYTLFVDSLAENDKPYYYRVRGISIFGEISEPSDTVSGRGVEVLPANPAIVRTTLSESGDAVEIQWEFDENAIHLVRSFELKRSNAESGPYETVVPEIPSDIRSTTYSGLKSTNYFRLAANGLNGLQTLSYPTLVMPVDSIPPAAPAQLVARADTSGLVYLNWKTNPESDLLGYKLYRGNRKGEELISLIVDVLPNNQYVDTVDLLNLNTHVYYAVKALDYHYNQSDFSEILAVEKPLKVKPSTPVFTDFKSEGDGITLRWIRSTDYGVVRHTLYRREETETENKPLAVFQQGDTLDVYEDTKIEGNKAYIYTLTATSKWNVESDPSPEFRVAALPANRVQALKDLKVIVDKEKQQIRLQWKNVALEKVKKWRLYRSENESGLALWKEIPAAETRVIDEFPMKLGDRYNYTIVAVMNDGGISKQENVTVKN
jgi:hypothetical protein